MSAAIAILLLSLACGVLTLILFVRDRRLTRLEKNAEALAAQQSDLLIDKAERDARDKFAELSDEDLVELEKEKLGGPR